MIQQTIRSFVFLLVAFIAFSALSASYVSSQTMNPNFNLDSLANVHKDEVNALQSAVDTCLATLNSLKAQLADINAQIVAQQKKITDQQAVIKTIQAQITNLNTDKNTLTAQYNTANTQANSEISLINNIKTYVNSLPDAKYKDEKAQLLPLLQAMLDRIKATLTTIQNAITAKTNDITNANNALTAAQKALTDLQAQLTALQTKTLVTITTTVTTQTSSCTAAAKILADRLAQIKQEQDMIKSICTLTPVPTGPNFAVSEFIASGRVLTFDGMDYTVPSRGDYIFLRTWDNTLTIQGRMSNLNQLTGVAMKLGNTITISVEEDGSVYVNGQPALLPARKLPGGVVIYERYSNGGSAIEIFLPNRARLRVPKLSQAGSFAKDLLFSAPRNAGYWKNTAGLAGVYDDNKNDEMLLSTHELILPAAQNAAAFTRFIQSWVVPNGESLFMFPPQSFTTATPKTGIDTLAGNAAQFIGTYGNRKLATNVLCQATGDPHYTTFDGKYLDMYGVGDFLVTSDLAQTLVVQARTMVWGSAAVNRVSVIKINQDIIQLTAATRECKVNGAVVKPDANGITLAGGGVLFKYTADNFRVSHPEGAYIDIYTYGSGATGSYQNQYIYLTQPEKFYDKLFGICGDFNGDVNNDLSYNGVAYSNGHDLGKQAFMLAARYAFFDVTYNAPDITIDITPVWKTPADKTAAETACKKKGFTGDQFNACVYDIWAFGSTIMADLAAQAAQNVIDDIGRYIDVKPSLYMPFDDVHATVAVDLSDSKSDGTLVGNSVIQNYQLVLSGGFVAASNVSRLTSSSGTVTFWLSIDNTGVPSNLVSVGSSSNGAAWQIVSSPAGLSQTAVSIGFTAGGVSLPMTTNIKKSTWVFVTAVWSNEDDVVALYINGQRTATILSPAINVKQIPNAVMRIGSETVNCLMKELRVFDFDLDLVQINALYHAGDEQYSRTLQNMLVAQQQLQLVLKTTVDQITVQLAACNTTTATIQQNYDAAVRNLTNAQTLLAQINTAYTAALAKNATNAAILSDAQVNLATQVSVCNGYQQQINQIPDLQSTIQLIIQIIQEISQLPASSETQNAINLLQDMQRGIQAQIDALIAGPQAQLQLCPGILQNMQNNITTLQGCLAVSSNLVVRIQNDIVAQQGVITAQLAAVNALKTQLSSQQSTCSTISQRITTVTADYNSQLATLQTKINDVLNMRQNGVL